MRLLELLHLYPDEALDHLAADKLDEISNLRLPREVLIQEIAEALSSLSYVGQALASTQPPTFAFLKLLMESPGRGAPAKGFNDKVYAATSRLTELSASGRTLPISKKDDYQLYVRMLYAAWEDDGQIDRSESHLLAALRKELGIGVREHLLLEHHPIVKPLWDNPRSVASENRKSVG